MADLPIVSVAVFEAKKEAHEKAAKEGEKIATVTFTKAIGLMRYCMNSGEVQHILHRLLQELQKCKGLRESHPVQKAPRDDSEV